MSALSETDRFLAAAALRNAERVRMASLRRLEDQIGHESKLLAQNVRLRKQLETGWEALAPAEREHVAGQVAEMFSGDGLAVYPVKVSFHLPEMMRL